MRHGQSGHISGFVYSKYVIRCFDSLAQAMRQRAAELGEKIQAEDGIANSVAIIERMEGARS